MQICHLSKTLAMLALLGWFAPTAQAADLVRLTPDNWDSGLVPEGKEVDCNYGDYVLRNNRITAVIAAPVAGRFANMTVHEVGGCVIDLTSVDNPNDQLSCYYPGSKAYPLRSLSAAAADGTPVDLAIGSGSLQSQGSTIWVEFASEPTPGKPLFTVRYTLADNWDYLQVTQTYVHDAAATEPAEFRLVDQIRADGQFEKTPNGSVDWFWVHDEWWQQAYGFIPSEASIACESDSRTTTLQYSQSGRPEVRLEPGQKATFELKLLPAENLLALRGKVAALTGTSAEACQIAAQDTAGNAVPFALVELFQGTERLGSGRTDAAGRLAFHLPPGEYSAKLTSVGHGEHTQPITIPGNAEFNLPIAGRVVAQITNESGGPTPCKVQFRGQGATPSPYFFPATGEHRVVDTYYSHNGQFEQPLGPGSYDCIISYGPEHDAVFTTLEIRQGEPTLLAAKLIRSVQTPGWISADFHNHSSPSGDNTSSQLGRVLNILCEQVEYAPCTEHNRLSSYVPHLQRLGVLPLMGTCTGMELTNNPGDVNHQNAFPLVMRQHIQDNGAPRNDVVPEVQIERLAMWDGGAEKLVQQNHPDIGHLFFDKNGDGTPDEGYAGSIPFIDVMEVHPISAIFEAPTRVAAAKVQNNRVVNWLQLLNQGYRIPGVVNTDSHQNHHESGYLRNYLRAPNDDPAQITVLDVVHAAEAGHVVMTNAPFMEVLLTAQNSDKSHVVLPGDECYIPDGKVTLSVRVQCANWYDIDRVQVLVNSRPVDRLNFSRQTTPGQFTGGTIKFEQLIPITLTEDAHIILVAMGENSTLGPVMGPTFSAQHPVAVSNPIYVDVDGKGFSPNKDTLDATLPTTGGRAAAN